MKIFLSLLFLFSLFTQDCRAWEAIVNKPSSVPATTPTNAPTNRIIDEATREQVRRDARDYEQSAKDFWAHMSLSQPGPKLDIPQARPNKNQAWILVGDVSSNLTWSLENLSRWWEWIKSKIVGNDRSGWENMPKGILDIAWSENILKQAKQALMAAGYPDHLILTERTATASDLKAVLRNPKVGALIWIGHGSPGSLTDANKKGIDGFLVRDWAVEMLEEKKMYQHPGTQNNPRMKRAMEKLYDRAHFGLDYFYAHACLTMQDPALAQRVVKSGGKYEGYFGSKLAYVAALTPAVSRISNMEIPDVHSLMVVPDLKNNHRQSAERMLIDKGFTVEKVIEDRIEPDKYSAGLVHSQLPNEGTIIDKNRSDKKVTLYVFKKADDTGSSLSLGDNREICDGIDNNGNNQIDEGCNYSREIILDDNECPDDTMALIVNGRNLGNNPAGHKRHYNASGLSRGSNKIEVYGVKSGGKAYKDKNGRPCGSKNEITYSVKLGPGMKFSGGGNEISGKIKEGTSKRYTVMVK